MRFLLAVIAVLGLMASPAAAAAASAACNMPGQSPMAAEPMPDMAAMPGMGMSQLGEDPCCDPGTSGKSGKMDALSCAQACAVMCGVLAALPSPGPNVSPPTVRAETPRFALTSVHAHEPNGLERPPRPIA